VAETLLRPLSFEPAIESYDLRSEPGEPGREHGGHQEKHSQQSARRPKPGADCHKPDEYSAQFVELL
jgi:hypothetical protein